MFLLHVLLELRLLDARSQNTQLCPTFLQVSLQLTTARVSLRKYFIPGCVGRGLDLDFRIRPAAASVSLGFFHLRIEVAELGFRTA